MGHTWNIRHAGNVKLKHKTFLLYFLFIASQPTQSTSQISASRENLGQIDQCGNLKVQLFGVILF